MAVVWTSMIEVNILWPSLSLFNYFRNLYNVKLQHA